MQIEGSTDENRARTRKLIQPGMQWRLILAFLGAAVVATLIHAYVLNRMLAQLGTLLPHDELVLQTEWPAVFRTSLVVAFALLVPSLVGIGILASFRVAGPLSRFEAYLNEVAAGRDPGPCRIRKSDELQHVADLLTRITAPLRAGSPPVPESSARSTAADSVPSLLSERSSERTGERSTR
jgi:hypothetical protein